MSGREEINKQNNVLRCCGGVMKQWVTIVHLIFNLEPK